MLDAHIHLAALEPAEDLGRLLDEGRRAGVDGWLSCSVDDSDWERTARLAEHHTGVRPAYGLHPWFLSPADEMREIMLPKGCAAVGEIGLDAHCDVPMERQLALFRRLLALAREAGLPAVIHARAPWPLVLEELSRFPGPAVIHNCTGSADTARQLIALGCRLSFGTALLAAPGKRIVNTVRTLPAHALLIETDAPYMAPEGGNFPALLARVASAVAEIRGERVETIGRGTAENLEDTLQGGVP